jgi:hypothetical protein
VDCDTTLGETPLKYGALACSTNVYVYTLSEMERSKIYFKNHFRYKSLRDTIKNLPVSIDSQSFRALVGKVRAIYPLQSDSGHAAVRFHFGMENRAMVIIFQPVFLSKQYPNIPDSSYKFIQSEIDSFYQVVGGQLVRIDTARKSRLIKNYQDNVYIVHIKDSNDTHFNCSSDFHDGDTRFALMPLQQIFRMYCENSPSQNDNITFQIVADSHYVTQGQKVENFKVHVVAYINEKVIDNWSSETFKDYAADFDQMCPPKCDKSIWLNYYDWHPTSICANKKNLESSPIPPGKRSKVVDVKE